MRRCRECGCLDQAACMRDGLLGPEVCRWLTSDLCSACAEEIHLGAPEGYAWEHPPRAYTDQLAEAR